MPLGKKRQAEYQKERRNRIVIPKSEIVIPKPWEITDWVNYIGESVPIPNCPDGRYREKGG